MSVYVDPAVWPFGRMLMCHMVTDDLSLEELHRMARKLDLKREWFQNKIGGTPHYDISKGKRAAAIRLGAIPVDRHGIVSIMNVWQHAHLL